MLLCGTSVLKETEKSPGRFGFISSVVETRRSVGGCRQFAGHAQFRARRCLPVPSIVIRTLRRTMVIQKVLRV